VGDGPDLGGGAGRRHLVVPRWPRRQGPRDRAALRRRAVLLRLPAVARARSRSRLREPVPGQRQLVPLRPDAARPARQRLRGRPGAVVDAGLRDRSRRRDRGRRAPRRLERRRATRGHVDVGLALGAGAVVPGPRDRAPLRHRSDRPVCRARRRVWWAGRLLRGPATRLRAPVRDLLRGLAHRRLGRLLRSPAHRADLGRARRAPRARHPGATSARDLGALARRRRARRSPTRSARRQAARPLGPGRRDRPGLRRAPAPGVAGALRRTLRRAPGQRVHALGRTGLERGPVLGA
jgi:hypothetical protein